MKRYLHANIYWSTHKYLGFNWLNKDQQKNLWIAFSLEIVCHKKWTKICLPCSIRVTIIHLYLKSIYLFIYSHKSHMLITYNGFKHFYFWSFAFLCPGVVCHFSSFWDLNSASSHFITTIHEFVPARVNTVPVLTIMFIITVTLWVNIFTEEANDQNIWKWSLK